MQRSSVVFNQKDVDLGFGVMNNSENYKSAQ